MPALYLVAILLASYDLTTSFLLPNVPGQQWIKVGYLNMSDPTQQCPGSWQMITSPLRSCGKKSNGNCESVNILAYEGSYQQVCGRFRGYQIGSPDAFDVPAQPSTSIETNYVDGVSITYGSPGSRKHVYTYAAGVVEHSAYGSCPCTAVGDPGSFKNPPPMFVGSDYFCESGNNQSINYATFFETDVLWDGRQCRSAEVTCCDPPNLPWFCKTFSTPISEDLEVRLCTDENLDNENVAIELFELYIRVPLAEPLNFSLSSVAGSPNQLRASWKTPILKNFIITGYTVHCNQSANPANPEQMIAITVPIIRAVVNGTTLAAMLNDLSPFLQYSCFVTANTSVGEGIPSVIKTASFISSYGFCHSELRINNGRGIYNWPAVLVGETISQVCQYGVLSQNVSRYCKSNWTWTENAALCPTEVTNRFNQLNNVLQNQNISATNVANVTAQMLDLVSQATLLVDQSRSNLAVVTTLLIQLSNMSSPNVPAINETIVNLVAVLSCIQTWPSTVLESNGSKIVKLFEFITSRLVQQQNLESQISVSRNLTSLFTQTIPLKNLTNEGSSYSFSMLNDARPPKSDAKAVLPPPFFESINKPDVWILYTIYNTASFFPLANSSNSSKIISLVLGVIVLGGNDIIFANLTTPVVFTFSVPSNNYSSYECVSWDFNASGGKGNWTSDGCITSRDNNISSMAINCQCSHLTNFAILVDISTRTENRKTHSYSLEIITYVGVSLSLLGLVITVVVLLSIKRQRKKDVSKYHIQLCCALIGMLLVFVVGIDRTETFVGCVTVSVLIHYFTLVAVMWMGAEALFMFQKLVFIFFRITGRYIFIVSLTCWVVPLVPVIIPLAIDRKLLVKRDASFGYCFISNTTTFFAAFLGPILLMLFFNTILFVAVIVVLLKHIYNRSMDKRCSTIRLMANIVTIGVLFGLTWIFGVFTILKADEAFQIVFTVMNSIQGFLIFIFCCVINRDVQLTLLRRASQISIAVSSLANGTQQRRDKSDVLEVKTLAPSAQPLSSTLRGKNCTNDLVAAINNEHDNSKESM